MAYDKWKGMALGEFVTLQRGHDLPEHSRKPGSVPVLGSFGITGYHSEARTTGPGVTVGRSGASFGVVSYCEDDFWPLNTALYVVNFHGNYPRFAYYLLKSLDFTRFNSGSAQPSLNRNFIHPIPIAVPRYGEQVAIAEFFAAFDDKTKLNLRMNETLEAISHALFKSWFVDLHPTRAKAAGYYDGPSKYVDESPNSFMNWELGYIPVGWHVKTFGDILSYSRVAIGDESARVYSATADGLAPRDERFLKQLSRSEQKNKKIECNDMVFGLSRRVLNFGLMKDQIGSVSPVYEVFKVDSSVYRPELLERYIRQRMDLFMDILKPAAREGQAIDRHFLLKKELLVPPLPIQDKFLGITEPIASKILVNQHEMDTLSGLRDALLPKLMSGEIRLKDAEKLVEAHT